MSEFKTNLSCDFTTSVNDSFDHNMVTTLPSLQVLKVNDKHEHTLITETNITKPVHLNVNDQITHLTTIYNSMDTETVNKDGKYSQTIFD